ncbi:hypothetical protein NDU88_008200 [Pleurodeles waltl]|uniref:Uncharacterized protein n=1 Tax=Pleurodeles waltl TaxID=8319 RepID=A0AAV7NYL8_PLEWA|nr:hypothetical protein NDU88_008200 [Pleurodeles waltl]
MVVTSAAVTSAAGRIITASAPVHWLLGPIGSNVNQCSIAPRCTTAYRDGVQRQRSYPTIPLSQFRVGTYWKMAESAGVPTAGGPVDNGRETFDRDLPVRPCHNPGTMYPVGARADVTNPPSDWNPP